MSGLSVRQLVLSSQRKNENQNWGNMFPSTHNLLSNEMAKMQMYFSATLSKGVEDQGIIASCQRGQILK